MESRTYDAEPKASRPMTTYECAAQEWTAARGALDNARYERDAAQERLDGAIKRERETWNLLYRESGHSDDNVATLNGALVATRRGP